MRVKDTIAVHLPIRPLKPCCWLEPVPRFKPSTYQPTGLWLSQCAVKASVLCSAHFYSEILLPKDNDYNKKNKI